MLVSCVIVLILIFVVLNVICQAIHPGPVFLLRLSDAPCCIHGNLIVCPNFRGTILSIYWGMVNWLPGTEWLLLRKMKVGNLSGWVKRWLDLLFYCLLKISVVERLKYWSGERIFFREVLPVLHFMSKLTASSIWFIAVLFNFQTSDSLRRIHMVVCLLSKIRLAGT